MFPSRYFPRRYFAGRYWPPASPPDSTPGGGYFPGRYFPKTYFPGRYFPATGSSVGVTRFPTLTAAIVDRLTGSSVCPRVYLSRTPPRPEYPLVLLDQLMTSPTISNSSNYYEATTFQFSSLSPDDIEAEVLARSAVAALSLPSRLLFVGGRHMSGWIDGDVKRIDPGPGAVSPQIHRVVFTFSFLVQENVG